MNLVLTHSLNNYSLLPGQITAVFDPPAAGASDTVALFRADGTQVNNQPVARGANGVYFDGLWPSGSYFARYFSGDQQVAQSDPITIQGVAGSTETDAVQNPVDQSNKTLTMSVTPPIVTPTTVVAPVGPSSIPIVGPVIDEVGSAALQIPIVGGLLGQASVMTGISPGLIALLGLGVGLYFMGAFDSGSGGRTRA